LDELLGYDGPSEFYCPISSEIMKEPVLLPTSGQICDLNTIKRHLLNDEHDPFNRAPLKISDLKEVPELKARVARWIQQKLAGEVTDEERNANGTGDDVGMA
jgi:ubiquitin conjugation factor E4 B